MVPQAKPSQVRTVLPPPSGACELQDYISFILVGNEATVEQLKRAAPLIAPRQEYEAAVKCLQEVSFVYANVELSHDELAKLPDHNVPAPSLLTTVTCAAEDEELAMTLKQFGPADAVEKRG